MILVIKRLQKTYKDGTSNQALTRNIENCGLFKYKINSLHFFFSKI